MGIEKIDKEGEDRKGVISNTSQKILFLMFLFYNELYQIHI